MGDPISSFFIYLRCFLPSATILPVTFPLRFFYISTSILRASHFCSCVSLDTFIGMNASLSLSPSWQYSLNISLAALSLCLLTPYLYCTCAYSSSSDMKFIIIDISLRYSSFTFTHVCFLMFASLRIFFTDFCMYWNSLSQNGCGDTNRCS